MEIQLLKMQMHVFGIYITLTYMHMQWQFCIKLQTTKKKDTC